MPHLRTSQSPAALRSGSATTIMSHFSSSRTSDDSRRRLAEFDPILVRDAGRVEVTRRARHRALAKIVDEPVVNLRAPEAAVAAQPSGRRLRLHVEQHDLDRMRRGRAGRAGIS